MASVLQGGVVAVAGRLGVKNGVVTAISVLVVVTALADKLWQLMHPPEEQVRTEQIKLYVEALVRRSGESPYATLEKGVRDLTTRYVEQAGEYLPKPRRGSEKESPSATEPVRPKLVGILEALANGGNLVIEGPPGVGKSSLLRYLCWTLSDRWQKDHRSDVPVLVTASRLAHPTQVGGLAARIWEAAVKQLGSGITTLPPRNLFEQRPGKASSWVVLVDGLDAMLDEGERRTLLKDLGAEGAPTDATHRFVVASRSLPELDDRQVSGFPRYQVSGFARYRIQPFDPAKVEEFAARWFADRSLHGRRAADLFSELVRSSRMANLAQIPLLLTLAAITLEPRLGDDDDTSKRHELPATRAALYNSFVTGSLEESLTVQNREEFKKQWESTWGDAGRASADQLFTYREELLERVARWQQEGGTGSLVEEAVRQAEEQGWLPQRIPDQASLRGRMLDLFLTRGLGYREADDFVFLHDTIREFLAASWEVSDRPDPESEAAWELIGRWRAPTRREVALFALGLWGLEGKDGRPPRRVTKLIERLCSSNALLFAASAVAEGADVDPRAARDVLSRLQAHVGDIRYPGALDVNVLAALCRRLNEVHPLVEVARDRMQDPSLRMVAAQAAANMGRTEEALAVLTEIARDREEPSWVRTSAARAAASMGRTEEALAVLAEIARDRGGTDDDQIVAIKALPEMGDEGFVVLSEIARDRGQVPSVRSQAAEILSGTGGSEEALRILGEIAQSRQMDSFVRSDVIWSLAREHMTEVGNDLFIRIANDRDEDVDVRAAAAEILARGGQTEEALPVLIEIARYSLGDVLLPTMVIKALGQLGRNEDAFQVLMQLAQDRHEDTSVRAEATRSLGSVAPTEEAFPVLKHLAQEVSGDASVQIAAIESLAGTGDESLPVILEIAQGREEDASVQMVAAQALAVMGRTEEACSVFIEIATDSAEDPEVRWVAAEGLTQLGQTEKSFLVLEQIVQNPRQRADLRAVAAKTLARLGRSQEAFRALKKIAKDRKQAGELRTFAAEALAGMGRTEEALPVLIEIARDPKQAPWVQSGAADALATLGGL